MGEVSSVTAIEVCWLAMNEKISSMILLSEHHHSTCVHAEVEERETYTDYVLYIPLFFALFLLFL